MATENRLFDDLARVASGALGTLSGVRTELETRIREQIERGIERMNLVRREEFDAVQEMAAKARMAQEALEVRVAALEARLAAPPQRRPLRLRPPPGRRPQKPV
ncbi:MAG TPA: accessory factor UbiK family protein [Stellaceae bacterium]|nr:accessory factor UbiK family protein [Stellaceae bacterium]